MRTFKTEIKISGIGIHSGTPVNMTIKPSDKYGIFFKRTDLPGTAPIAARYDNVGKTNMRNTTVGDPNGAHVQTIEHLMASLFVVGVDSAVIEIDGPETPILDGSAKEFCRLLCDAKITDGAMRKIIVKKPVIVKKSEVMKQLPFLTRIAMLAHDWMLGRRNNGFIKLTPNANGLNIRATMSYPDKVIGTQSFEYFFDGGAESVGCFLSDISAARTFGRYSEWEYLKSKGMGRGASQENVIALNDKGDGTLNPLIWADEFVRHQVIDTIGDMFTSGGFLHANVELYKGGHALNNLVLKKLFSDPANYDIIESK